MLIPNDWSYPSKTEDQDWNPIHLTDIGMESNLNKWGIIIKYNELLASVTYTETPHPDSHKKIPVILTYQL